MTAARHAVIARAIGFLLMDIALTSLP